MKTQSLLLAAAAAVAAFVYLRQGNSNNIPARNPFQVSPPPPPSPPQFNQFSYGGAGLNQSAPGSTVANVNGAIAVANNALGFFNNVSSLWQDDTPVSNDYD